MIFLVVVFLFFDQTSSLDGCGTTLYQQSGALSLSDNTVSACQWRIVAEKSEKIVLNITEVDIVKSPDCSLGSIAVYDGLWETSPLLGRFCGSGALDILISSANKLLVSYINPNHGRFSATYQSVCGGALFLQNSTVLKSHESGATYPHNRKCIWFVVVPDEYQVRLDFFKFRLEYEQNCLYDYVEVSDGFNQNSSIGKFCGTNVPPSISSSSRSLQIKFVSDHSINDEGFEIGITPVRDYCDGTHGCAHYCNNTLNGYFCSCRSGYQLLSDGRNCGPICGATLNDTYGGIEFSTIYGTPLRCVWNITVPAGHVVTLEFFRFSVGPQCETQFLEIFSGSGNSSVHETFCGVVPGNLVTREGNVEIVLTSRSNITGPMFSLNYASCKYVYGYVYSLKVPKSCGQSNGNCHHQCSNHQCLCENGYQLQPNNLDCKSGLCNYEISAPSGVVTSPGYPNAYANNINCTWSFRTTPGHTISMNFSDIDIENHNTCHYDHVRIVDGPSSNNTNLSQLCGRNNTNGTLVQSTSNEVYMIFKTDQSNSGRGFRANYSSVCGGTLTPSIEEKYIFSHDQYLVSDYYHNTECSWNFVPRPGYRTKLTIENFYLERAVGCNYDFVEIFNNGISVGRFCGTTVPREFVSQFALRVRFRTDGSVARKGFQIKYQEV